MADKPEKKTRRKKADRYVPRPVGRPSEYDPALAQEFCHRVAEGETVAKICDTPGMPRMTTFFTWMERHPEFKESYAHAKSVQLERMADETLHIADNATNDWMEKNDPENPGYRANGDHISRSRLRVDTRKWLLSKLAPKKYGDLIGKYEAPAEIQVEVDSMAIARRVAVMLLTAARNQDVEDVVVKEKK